MKIESIGSVGRIWSSTSFGVPVRGGVIAEWCVTIIIPLFSMSSLLQAYVIPSASMEDSLLTGDHLLVDKLVHAPQWAVSKRLLPYRDVRRRDVIVFRYPLNIKEDYVKRAIGIPGDHIRLSKGQLMLNGRAVSEALGFCAAREY